MVAKPGGLLRGDYSKVGGRWETAPLAKMKNPGFAHREAGTIRSARDLLGQSQTVTLRTPIRPERVTKVFCTT